MWTPPHFWALALFREDDYARAGVPMLPVVAGADETRRQILLYSAHPRAHHASFRRSSASRAGSMRGGAACSARYSSGCAWRSIAGARATWRDGACKRLFVFSIFYLFALFAMIIVERVLGHRALRAGLG